MEDKALAIRLTRVYAKLLGERDRIDNPPKRLTRLIPDREAYSGEAAARSMRRDEIEVSLVHLGYVIKMLDPQWFPSDVVAIKPNSGRGRRPPGGWIGAALDCLRDSGEAMTVAEIVSWIAHKHDYDVSTVALRQKYHTAVNNSLVRFRGSLIKTEGYPTRWSLAD
jgi:hypothetical protein